MSFYKHEPMTFYRYEYRITSRMLQTERPMVELIVLGLRILSVLYNAANRTLHSSYNVPVTMQRALLRVGTYSDNPPHLEAIQAGMYRISSWDKIAEMPLHGAVFMLDTFLRAMRTAHPDLHVVDKNRVLIMTPIIRTVSGAYASVLETRPKNRFNGDGLRYLLKYLEVVAERMEVSCPR